VCRVEQVRTEFVSKLGIMYENGGPVTLWVNSIVIATMDGIRPLAKVETVETIVAWPYKGELGGRKPPVVIVVEGV
jgi:hypothetical protein